MSHGSLLYISVSYRVVSGAHMYFILTPGVILCVTVGCRHTIFMLGTEPLEGMWSLSSLKMSPTTL